MTTNIVNRRDFIKIFSVLFGAIAGSDLIAKGKKIFDLPVVVPDIWDGSWHTIRFFNKATKLSISVDGELFQSTEAIRDISEITKPLDKIFSMGEKTIHELIGGNYKETVFVKFGFKSDGEDKSTYLDDIYYGDTVDNQDDLAGVRVIQEGFEYGEVDPGAPVV